MHYSIRYKSFCCICFSKYWWISLHSISAVYSQFFFQVIDVDIDLVAHHKGFFAFKLCPQNNPTETVLASCFDKYPLKLETGERFYHLAKNNIHGPGRIKARVQLPIGLTCWHCIIQTTYVSGNYSIYSFSYGTPCSYSKRSTLCFSVQ